MPYSLKDPTTIPEMLFLERELRKMNFDEMAARWGVGRARYIGWEAGSAIIPSWVTNKVIYIPNIQETCIIYRRRMGWTQRDLGKIMNNSFTMIRHLESGRDNPKPLIDFWTKMLNDPNNDD